MKLLKVPKWKSIPAVYVGKCRKAVSFLEGDIAPVREYRIPGTLLPNGFECGFILLIRTTFINCPKQDIKQILNPPNKIQ